MTLIDGWHSAVARVRGIWSALIYKSPLKGLIRTPRVLIAVTVLFVLGWLQYPGFVQTRYDVQFTTVKRDDLVALVTSTGTVQPVTTVDVSSQLSGQVAEVLVDFNEKVVSGQTLARLDSDAQRVAVRQAEAELDSANAQLELAQKAVSRARANVDSAVARRSVIAARREAAASRQANAAKALERSRSLAASRNAPESAVEAAESSWLDAQAAVSEQVAQIDVEDAAIASARAALAMADAQQNVAYAREREREAALERTHIELARTEIRAPIDGVVILRNVARGQTVAASLQSPTLFTVAQDLGRVELEVSVDEADIGQIEPGHYVVFAVDAYPANIFSGRVRQIRKSPRRIQSVVTYSVVVEADNPGERLMPGMTALVRIAVNDATGALVAPNSALRLEPPAEMLSDAPMDHQGSVLWRQGDDNLVAVAVGTGITNTEVTEILSGVAEGDEVVTRITVEGRILNLLGIHFSLGPG